MTEKEIKDFARNAFVHVGASIDEDTLGMVHNVVQQRCSVRLYDEVLDDHYEVPGPLKIVWAADKDGNILQSAWGLIDDYDFNEWMRLIRDERRKNANHELTHAVD